MRRSLRAERVRHVNGTDTRRHNGTFHGDATGCATLAFDETQPALPMAFGDRAREPCDAPNLF